MNRNHWTRILLAIGALVGLLAVYVPRVRADEEDHLPGALLEANLSTVGASASGIDWLEPRGLSIIDLVGQVPEAYLRGSIISYTPGYGILRYESGYRNGDTVVITAKVEPRYIIAGNWNGTMFGCLGQPARIDQLGTVSPPSTVRLYNGAVEVTRQVDLYTYVPSGLIKPIRNPQQSEWENQYRYPESALLKSQFTADGALILPGNMGCEIIMSYKNYRELTAVFTLQSPVVINVEVVGTQTFTFHSYLGVGYAGLLQPLVNQLRSRFGERHEKFDLNIPAQADYLWLNFPAMPVDMYTQFPGNPTGNVDRPIGGTYRIDGPSGLSVDHVSSKGLPLGGNWKDMDLAYGAVYLPYIQGNKLAAPEYFVPAGVSYHPCMLQGNCSPALLEQIYNTPMTMTAVYLKVERTGCGLQIVPLRLVGPGWSPPRTAGVLETPIQRWEEVWETPIRQWELTASSNEVTTAVVQGDGAIKIFSAPNYFVYLPAASKNFCAVSPEVVCAQRPCGWMTNDGRMVDFVP